MISSDDHIPPSDPSSHDFNINRVQKAHASDSDIDLYFKYLVADLDDISNTHPSFSIRDYVFGSRNKDIACNWPFSHKTLKACLQHGVKNLLPSFESLESLRNTYNEEIISSVDRKSDPELNLKSKKSKKSQTHLQEDSCLTKSKKPVLVTYQRPETAMKNNPMASKICPVCKTFSSSSNTTLNAHIDQCLSCESSMKWTPNPEVNVKHRIKPRIKPRKMRTMVDIYKTALRCTVEELDARNGTSWANNSSFPDQETEFLLEDAANVVHEVSDHEGDVYIDNNGTKVRILSVPKVDNKTSHDHQVQKKGGKSNKFITEKKKNKNHEDKQHHKCLKLSPKSKKFCFPNPNHQASSLEVTVGKSCNKEDQGKETVNQDDYPIVRPPWACSKRTVLAKKLHKLRTPLRSSNKLVTFSEENSQRVETFPEFTKFGQYAKKRSQLLVKPTSKHMKKKGTLLHDNCEDCLDACTPSKQSDFRSKGSKFLSLKKKSSPGGRGKRKSSALKESCVHPLSKENAIMGSLQDSMKHQSRVEEDTREKTSCESLNLLEVRKNEETKIHSQENSVASRSLKVDSICDIESARKVTRGIVVASLNLDSNVMFSEKLQENSSMADTSQFDSIEEHRYHDITDRYFISDSPISTISNPSMARSDSDKFSVRSTSHIDETYAPISSNNQPCCCSIKETQFSQVISSSYQESNLLRKHDIEFLNFKPQMFPFSNDMILNLSTSPPPPMKPPPYRECESVDRPVLRLMGKNLTVVKTDDDVYPNVQNEYKNPSFGYHIENQNGFKSQNPAFQPPNNLRTHAFGTMFQSTFDDRTVMHNEEESDDAMNTRRNGTSLYI